MFFVEEGVVRRLHFSQVLRLPGGAAAAAAAALHAAALPLGAELGGPRG